MQRQVLAARRRQSLAVLSRKRKATVITLIHRQETVSLLGIPLARYIDIDDAQGILRPELLNLYPQPRGREAAVEYAPAAPARLSDGARSQPHR